MNKSIKAVAISISIFIVVISGFSIIATDNDKIKNAESNSILPFDNSSLSSEYVIKDKISGINIDWQNGNVSITPFDGKQVIIKETSERALQEKQHLTYQVTNGILNVEYSKISSAALIKNYQDINCDIYVPFGMFEGLKAQIEVNGVSSDILISDFSLEDLTLSTVSGNINIRDITADSSTIKSVSGDIVIESTISNVLECTNTSGGIQTYAQSNDIIINSVSGTISVAPPSIFERADIKTVSGAINVTIPENEGLKIDVSKVSGNFQCDLQVTLQNGGYFYKNGKIPLNIKTTSGNIHIMQ